MRYLKLFEDWKEKKERLHGAEHEVYPVKHDPNRVYKVGDKSSIMKWAPLFKKYPEIFPYVYRIAPLKQKINTGFSGIANMSDPYYAEVEKLDDKKAQLEYEKLKTDMYNSDVHTLYGSKFDKDDVHLDDVFRDCLKSDNFYNKVENFLKDKECHDTFVRWFEFIKKANGFIEPLKKDGGGTGFIIDIHSGKNFGYDKSGNLKCLDI